MCNDTVSRVTRSNKDHWRRCSQKTQKKEFSRNVEAVGSKCSNRVREWLTTRNHSLYQNWTAQSRVRKEFKKRKRPCADFPSILLVCTVCIPSNDSDYIVTRLTHLVCFLWFRCSFFCHIAMRATRRCVIAGFIVATTARHSDSGVSRCFDFEQRR